MPAPAKRARGFLEILARALASYLSTEGTSQLQPIEAGQENAQIPVSLVADCLQASKIGWAQS